MDYIKNEKGRGLTQIMAKVGLFFGKAIQKPYFCTRYDLE